MTKPALPRFAGNSGRFLGPPSECLLSAKCRYRLSILCFRCFPNHQLKLTMTVLTFKNADFRVFAT